MNNYQSYVEVNMDNLIHNYRELKKISNPAKICAVVKANGYGLGSITIAKELEKEGVDYLAVANAGEAIEIRDNDVKLPILILGYVKDTYIKDVLENDLEMTVYNYKQCEKINEIAKMINKVANIHIKLDTGMNRLGYLTDDLDLDEDIKEIKRIKELSNINIKGIYSHLADADGEDLSYTKKQYEKFSKINKLLEDEFINIPIKHISNDAGAIVCGYYEDMIRIGIGMYGYYPSNFVKKVNKVELKPVASLFTTVSNVKYINEGDFVGYNCTFQAKRKTKVATLAIGYADGYPIQLSNKGYVKIKGKKANIIGKVCMDQSMVDITDIDNVEIGDSVLLYGSDEFGELPLNDLANMSDTIVYDLICRITMRVPRVYKRNKQIFNIINYLER